MRGYNEMKLRDGVFTIWNTSMLLGVYMALGHTLACISCHGWMGAHYHGLGAHWRQCQEDSDLPEDFVKYL